MKVWLNRFFIVLALVLLLGSFLLLPAQSPVDAQEEDGCTWKCSTRTWDGDNLRCEGAKKDCTACELVCPAILQPTL